MTSDFGPDDECAVFISFDNPFSLAAAALIGSILKRKQTTRALTIYMAGIDEMLDDGDLTTGSFRAYGDRYYRVILP